MTDLGVDEDGVAGEGVGGSSGHTRHSEPRRRVVGHLTPAQGPRHTCTDRGYIYTRLCFHSCCHSCYALLSAVWLLSRIILILKNGSIKHFKIVEPNEYKKRVSQF